MPHGKTSCILTWGLYILIVSSEFKELNHKQLKKQNSNKAHHPQKQKKTTKFSFFKRENQKYLNHNSMEIFHLIHVRLLFLKFSIFGFFLKFSIFGYKLKLDIYHFKSHYMKFSLEFFEYHLKCVGNFRRKKKKKIK